MVGFELLIARKHTQFVRFCLVGGPEAGNGYV